MVRTSAEGTYKWGTTITTSYFPLDNSAFFNECDLNLVDWLGQYTADNAEENTESFKRSFLGRMLFSGDDVFKPEVHLWQCAGQYPEQSAGIGRGQPFLS